MRHKQPSWIAIIAVILVCLWSRTGWCQYAPTSGPYKVLTVDNIVLHDPARNKNIPIKIYYPAACRTVSGHHLLPRCNGIQRFLLRPRPILGQLRICKHSSFSRRLRCRFRLQRHLAPGAQRSPGWENRPEDVSFIIDSLAHVETFAPQLVGKLDLRHIGVGGHSFGAYTAGLIGGTTILLPGKAAPQSFADKRVSAVVLLSPQGEGIMGLSAHSWDAVRVPMLLMYGSRDFGPFGQEPVWRSEAFAKGPAGNKYEVELEGGTHMGFAGLFRDEGHRVEVFQCAKLETLAFWDAYLKQDPKARQYVESHGLQKFSGDIARFANK